MIKLSKPDLREEDIAQAMEVLRSGMLVQGKNVAAFERKLEEFTRLPRGVVLSSGTAALHLALKALGIGPGDTVLAPAFTFPATANVIEALGAETALCDVDPESYVVTPEALTERIAALKSRRLKAVMVVHEFGYPARIAEIAELCRKHGLLLIEDAACALGTVADGHHPGYFGDVACLSFHPRKAITTGEGGAILTTRTEVAEQVARLRNHGIMQTPAGLDFTEAGLNYRLTDFQAALALGQLDRFAEELARRRALADSYRRELQDVVGLALPDVPTGHSLQSFMVVLPTAISRNQMIADLRGVGIETNLGAQALNCLTYYRNKYNLDEQSCPVATRLYHSGLTLPLYGTLREKDVLEICLQMRNLAEGGHGIR